MKIEKLFDARYASEVEDLDSIPAGYINKTVCGCGLTSLAIEKEKGNTIIAVPSVDLVNNKVSQYPNSRFSDKLSRYSQIASLILSSNALMSCILAINIKLACKDTKLFAYIQIFLYFCSGYSVLK